MLGAAAVKVADVARDSQGIVAEDLSDPVSDTATRREGLRIPAPSFSSKPETFTAWRESFLDYAGFHAFVRCWTGQLGIDPSRVKTESQVISS